MSKRFTFPLQKALDWYRQKLTEDQAELQRIIGEINTLDRLKESLERREHAERAQLHGTGEISGTELSGLANYSQLIRAEIARVLVEKARRDAILVEQRKRLTTHHRRVRVLEELEQRRKAEWTRHDRVQEDTNASDLFLASMVREAADTTGQ